jgi:branched-chain amino acid transport system substrate-binding protein
MAPDIARSIPEGARWLSLCIFCFALVIGTLGVTSAVRAAEAIVVGVLHSEKFPYATMMKRSFEMALQEINQRGGVKGNPLKLVCADDRGARRAGEDAVRRLVKEAGAVIITGGYSSTNTIYSAHLAETLDVPFLITTAADDRITRREWANVYRMNPPAKQYAQGVEQLLRERLKPSSMAIVYENSPYGTGGALQMMWFCREYGIELRKIVPYHRERATSEYPKSLLEPLQADAPDVIYMVSYLRDAVALVQTVRALKIDSQLIGGAGGFTHEKFIAKTGDLAEGLLTATLWTHQLSYEGTKQYYDGYVGKHSQSPDYHGAEAYSALFVIADALERAKSLKSADLRAALDEADVVTAFGPVNFDSYDGFERQNSLPTMVLQVRKGTFEVVWPKDIATAPLAPGRGNTGGSN